MNLAVKLYKDVEDRPEGIPELWPVEVKQLGDSTTLPDGPWALMSEQDYADYVRYHKPAYDSWWNLQPKDARTFEPA